MALDPSKVLIYAKSPLEFWLDLHFNGSRFGDIADETQIEWLKSIAPTVLALARGEKAAVRRFLLETVKGWAKTSLIAMVVLWLVAFCPRYILIVVVARDFEQAAELLKAAKEIFRDNMLLDGRVEIQRNRIINPTPGIETIADVWTRDNLGQHGGRPSLTIIDEFTHIDDWELVNTALDNATKRPDGVVILSGNAGFVDTPAYALRELYRTTPGYSFFQYARPVPWQDQADLREAEVRNTRSRYRRLFWGEWSQGGDALDPQSIADAIDPTHVPMKGTETGFYFFAGLDLGIKHDHAAFCVLAADPVARRIKLAHVESWKPTENGEVDLRKIRQAVFEAASKFNFWINGCFYDPWQAELMAQDLRNAGVHMVPLPFQGKNLDLMASKLLQVFRDRAITLYDDAELRRDLQKLLIVEKSYGYRLVAPKDETGHADRAQALAIVLPAAIEAATVPMPVERSEPIAIDDRSLNQALAMMGGNIW